MNDNPLNLSTKGMESVSIPVRSERQAMDWSLVLASQDIPASIERSEEERWSLVVEPRDRERALGAIRLYRLENRRWRWEQQLPGSEEMLHWGGFLWAMLLVFIYRLGAVEFPLLYSVADFDSRAVHHGQWWRTFTAVLLHADIAHLLANVTTGILLLGLAMSRYGPGCGLLAAFLCGAAGNIAGLLLRSEPYHGLGASGMVMGALGLISVQMIPAWYRKRSSSSTKPLIKAAAAGMLLFVLFGTSKTSDVIAHSGGFVAGLLIGTLFAVVPQATIESKATQTLCWLILTALLITTASIALWSPVS